MSKRKLSEAVSTPSVINDAADWVERREARQGPDLGYFAFYSSAVDAITTTPALMHIPIDDHAIVRGHAVFDTCSLASGRLYRLQIHLDRLFASAQASRLPLPFGQDEDTNRSKMVEIIKAVARASGRQTCDIRYWVTAGTGNLGVTPAGCIPEFYVLAFGGLPMNPAWQSDGISEASVPSSVVPLKPKHLAELKSNNYMLNALTMMAAKDRGGTFGIGVDADGYVMESCVLNVCVVGKDGWLRTPPFANLLRGCTVRRVMALAAAELVEGAAALLKGVAQERIQLHELYNAEELFLVAGDTHIFACSSLDGRQLGTGKPGSVMQRIRSLLEADAHGGEADHESIHL